MDAYRSSDDKRALGPDKYGDTYQFADGTHQKTADWKNISTVLKNGQIYKIEENTGKTGIQRGPFMWMDNSSIIHIVHGRKGLENKKRLVDNVVQKNQAICQVSWEEDAEVSGRWNVGWCYWHTWDNYPEAYIKFLQFTTNCNFLKE